MISKSSELWQEECSSDQPKSIPRIYSGTILDFYVVGKDLPRGGQIGAFLFWDIPLSLVADTVILPYTLYTQIRYGSHECRDSNSEATADT
ncbi:MAG: hypothetical protein CMN85_14695 [Spongiibacteraceae bacterium]|nr:hypothetical protein [Spongiibacteraceae bacterium]